MGQAGPRSRRKFLLGMCYSSTGQSFCQLMCFNQTYMAPFSLAFRAWKTKTLSPVSGST